MLEKELFALLGKTADAAFTVTESGEICSWNEAAEHLFGYAASEVIGRNIDEVIEARGALGGLPFGGAPTRQSGRTDCLHQFRTSIWKFAPSSILQLDVLNFP